MEMTLKVITQQPIVLCSACLGGMQVRYDGACKPHSPLRWLEDYVQLRMLCPEVDAGMGVPRPPIQLVKAMGEVQALGRDDKSINATAALKQQAQLYCQQVKQDLNICAMILKDKSPSCGLGSTAVFTAQGQLIEQSSGIIAKHLRQQLPWLLLIEQSQLATDQHCKLLSNACLIIQAYRSQSMSADKTLHLEGHGNLFKIKKINLQLVLTLAQLTQQGEWALLQSFIDKGCR